ncbi:Fatty acyl-CoA synthetase A [Smittium culicis]|uniref:Fatty acyl-CoA synthetase A n=1 Tax=Smittium culicis TaxID=133412 RepID=A0A1R1Y3M5_9FUNG|nr:Fatty acyl-CoA synthetase A [Smittium culicis]
MNNPDYYSAPEFRSYVVPNSTAEGFSPILRNTINKDSLDIADFKEAKTVYDIFWNAVEKAPNNPYVGHRPYDPKTKTFLPYVFQSFRQIADRVNNFSSGLVKLRHELSRSEQETSEINARNWPVAIYSINRPEWNIAERACYTQSNYSVALYDTLGSESMEYIMNHSGASIIVCSLDKVSRILQTASNIPTLRAIISMDPLSTTATSAYVPSPYNVESINILKEWAESKNVKLYDFNQIESLGSKNLIKHTKPTPDSIYTLMYTSGTTGNPKGVVSSHRSYASSGRFGTVGRYKINDNHVFISYLPLAHTYGRNTENTITLLQGCIGYFSGDISKILNDCQALKPTSFPGIPRLLNRFYDIFYPLTIGAPGMKGVLYRHAFDEKFANMKNKLGLEHKYYDETFFKPIKAMISPNLRFLGSGSASIEPKILDFMRVVLSADTVEGYGLTETSSAGVRQVTGDITSGNIGIPTAGTEARLISVPEMNYYVDDTPCPRGELLIRGDSLFVEYLKEPEKTNEVFISAPGDAEAGNPNKWFCTGDIARINPDGSISIIDRKKSLFKLSQGEYVAPEKIENILIKHPLIMQAFIYGLATENYPVGVVVPDPATFIPWASKIIGASSDGATVKELASNKIVHEKFMDVIVTVCKEAKLNGFEIIKKLHIEHVPFDVEGNKILTPTLKLKRFNAIQYYLDTVKQLYKN